jgi:hypothetical protein
LACRSAAALRELAQFSVWKKEFRCATIQADNELWENPHDRLVNVFQSGKMDAYFPGELALVD